MRHPPLKTPVFPTVNGPLQYAKDQCEALSEGKIDGKKEASTSV